MVVAHELAAIMAFECFGELVEEFDELAAASSEDRGADTRLASRWV